MFIIVVLVLIIGVTAGIGGTFLDFWSNGDVNENNSESDIGIRGGTTTCTSGFPSHAPSALSTEITTVSIAYRHDCIDN